MYCEKCGTKLRKKDNFCPNCGCIINEPPQETNQNNEQKTGVTPPQNKQVPATAIASLIIGILSLALSFVLNIFVIPLSITGACLGFATKEKSGVKTAGIIISIISFVLSIVILVLIGSIFIYGIKNAIEGTERDDAYKFELSSSPVNGRWDCKAFDGSGEKGDFIVTLDLRDDLNYSWYKYNDKTRNHVYGYYSYEDINKSTAELGYKYYSLRLTPDEYVVDGEEKQNYATTKYEIGISNDEDEAILMNESTYNMYYCYKE